MPIPEVKKIWMGGRLRSMFSPTRFITGQGFLRAYDVIKQKRALRSSGSKNI
jgi:hypothetical protein